jgi:hypothetical protein
MQFLVSNYPFFSTEKERGQTDRRSSKVLKPQPVIDSVTELLFAAEILLCHLNRNMTEQKLDLLQLPSRHVAELRARTPKVMRCEPINAGTLRRSFHDVPDGFR